MLHHFQPLKDKLLFSFLLLLFIFYFIFFCRKQPDEIFDPAEFPSSYKDNLPKEQIVLQYAENFSRQYAYLYRDRKPLLLNPVNECGVEVCYEFKVM